jgi:hypothetical protein
MLWETSGPKWDDWNLECKILHIREIHDQNLSINVV